MGEAKRGQMRVERVLSVTPQVFALVAEYYEAAQVVLRDGRAAMQSMLEDGESGVWVAYGDNAAAGCVVLKAGVPHADAGECKRLYVRPAFRRLHLAEALMDALETHARGIGLRWVYLDTHETFRASVALYRGRGYVECARYNENPQATLFFRKQL